jgi:hypothetical protein
MKRFVYATDFSENSRYVASFIKAVSKKEEVHVRTPNIPVFWDS